MLCRRSELEAKMQDKAKVAAVQASAGAERDPDAARDTTSLRLETERRGCASTHIINIVTPVCSVPGAVRGAGDAGSGRKRTRACPPGASPPPGE